MKALLCVFLSLILNNFLVAQTDNSDFRPCLGSNTGGPLSQYRLMIGTSSDGVTWSKTDQVLSDESSVSDGLVLADGTVLVYYVAGCAQGNPGDPIKVAKSQNNGETWSYHEVGFSTVSGTKPVDPNVVLMPNGDVYMLVTIDPDGGGSLTPRSFKCISTDGGMTFQVYDSVYTVKGSFVLDPENFRVNSNTWYVYAGGVPGQNLYGKSTDDGSYFVHQGQMCTAMSQDPPDCYVATDIAEFSAGNFTMFAMGDVGNGYREIVSLSSTDCLNWTLDSGVRMPLNTSSTVESKEVWASTAIKLNDGTYFMVYETYIPASWSGTLSNISITPDNDTLSVGETLWFAAMGIYADASKRDLTSFATWASSDPSVGSIDSRGMFIAKNAGNTNVTASDSSAVSNTSVITVLSSPGIITKESEPQINVYPNPAHEFISVDLLNLYGEVTLSVFDYLGRRVVQKCIESAHRTEHVDVRRLSEGIYFLQIRNNRKSVNHKFAHN